MVGVAATKKATIYGVGINDAVYVTQIMETSGHNGGKRKQNLVWVCPYYRVWSDMLKRCYSAKYQEKYPTYKGCTVSDEWLTFSNFKSWMEKQDYEGMHLDKDLLFSGNKIYSAETCVFVSGAFNNFTVEGGATRGEWPIGVSWNKNARKFTSKCRNPYTKKMEHLGYFTCPQEAHQIWLKRKLELAHLLAGDQTDKRVAKALIERYTNYGASL